MNIHFKSILAMATAFSIAMVPQSHAFAFGEVQVDEEYSVSLADRMTSCSPNFATAYKSASLS